MHELGVTFKVLDIVEDTAKENGMAHVDRVILELGEVSTVIESYLQNCWKWAVKKRIPEIAEAELVVETIPALSECDDCGAVFGTVNYGKTCPVCGGKNTFLKQGNEFTVKEIQGY